MNHKKLVLTVLNLMLITLLSAQNDGGDFFRSIGKIYVVVAVIIAIFVGIILFLIYLERKLTRLEHQIIDNE